MSKEDKTIQKIIIGISITAASFLGIYYFRKYFLSETGKESEDVKETVIVKKHKEGGLKSKHIVNSKQAERITKIGTIFNQYDADKDGTINLTELSDFLDTLADKKHMERPSETEKKILFKKIHNSTQGNISLDEFLKWFESTNKKMNFSNLNTLFKKYDLNNDGTIDQVELRKFLDDFSQSQGTAIVTDHQLKKFLNYLDQNNKGSITFPEFQRWAVKFNENFQWKKIKTIFDQYSKDSENLTHENVHKFLNEISKAYKIPKPTSSQVQNFFDKINLNNNGKITYLEFAEWIKQLETDFQKNFDIEKLFHLFDENNNGLLDTNEWFHFMDYLGNVHGKNISNEEKLSFMKKVDLNHSGDISFPEFKYWFENQNQNQEQDQE